jgi:hypothetical protein
MLEKNLEFGAGLHVVDVIDDIWGKITMARTWPGLGVL